MELKREEIVKALECCTNCNCDVCPYVPEQGTHKGTIGCNDELMINAISLINELTEENERLKKRLKATNYMITPDERIEMIPTVESVRADTVREMQERLKVRFKGGKCNLYTVYNIQRYIDQIAEEILEGKNGNKED